MQSKARISERLFFPFIAPHPGLICLDLVQDLQVGSIPFLGDLVLVHQVQNSAARLSSMPAVPETAGAVACLFKPREMHGKVLR